jgi:hypothetical protein
MTTTATTTAGKATLCRMIRAFIAQRSGIDYRDYGNDRAAFLSDYRPMLRDGRDARRLLDYVEGRDGITAADILNTTSGNGRLEFVYVGQGLRLEYCTGQYFPTEYRAAACSMLAGLVWRYLANDYRDCDSTGDQAAAVRKAARRIFGRGIAGRWFA